MASSKPAVRYQDIRRNIGKIKDYLTVERAVTDIDRLDAACLRAIEKLERAIDGS